MVVAAVAIVRVGVVCAIYGDADVDSVSDMGAVEDKGVNVDAAIQEIRVMSSSKQTSCALML